MSFVSKLICLISLWIVTISLCSGQNIEIKIRDNDNKPLPGAAVQLTYIADSVTVSRATDQKGIAVFEKQKNGLHRVKITYVGFETFVKTIVLKPESKHFDFQLKEKSVGLEVVTVTARTPLMRQEDDKTIIDPTPLIGISTNTLEVLENTPGLYVDQDGGIYLTSATPAVVYINGREQKMSTQDITTLLRNLPPGSVQRIEVMRTPSTKYDAASSGGIINIVLKKGVKLGQFGTVNAGMNQGVYGNRFGGISYSTGGEKSSSYINANYNYNDLQEKINSVRYLTNDTALHQAALSRPQSNQMLLGYGINYNATEKLTLSYDGRINYNIKKVSSVNNNIIDGIDSLKLLESNNYITNKSNALNIQQDFGMNRKYDTLGSEWDTKFSYNFNNNKAHQEYRTDYTFPVDISVPSNGDNNLYRHFFLLQSDLTYQLPLKIKLETGFKSTLQDYNSKSDYYKIQNGNSVSDSLRTNAFKYQERINAIYVQVSRKLFFDFQLKAGLRLEHTYMKGNQTLPADTSFIVNRADWFPYLYLSRKLIHIMGIDLFGYIIYRRTISRPDYDNLNPYIKYVDQFLYETGNPALKPQFTKNVEMNISFDDMPIFAIGQNLTTDIFSNVVYKDKTQPAIAVRTYDNLGKDKETYLRLIAGIPPGNKYFFAIGSQYNLNEYNGIYENEALSYKRGSWRFFTFHSLTLFKETKIRVSGFMMVNGQFNFYELKNFGQLNCGISQTLFSKKLTISLNARDVLHTMLTEFSINQGSIHSYGDRYSDNQRYGINISYNFGIKDKGKDKEKKKGMIREENEE